MSFCWRGTVARGDRGLDAAENSGESAAIQNFGASSSEKITVRDGTFHSNISAGY